MLNSTRKRLPTESAASTMDSSSRSRGLLLSLPVGLDTDNDNVEGKETSDKDTPIIGIRRSGSWRNLGAKSAHRLTIFGATFGGTLGRKRKPPPRFV